MIDLILCCSHFSAPIKHVLLRHYMNAYARPPSQRLNLLPHVLRDNIVKGAAAFVAALQADDPTVLDRFIADLIAPRTVEEFPLAVLHRAFTVFGEMLVPCCVNATAMTRCASWTSCNACTSSSMPSCRRWSRTMKPAPRHWSGASKSS